MGEVRRRGRSRKVRILVIAFAVIVYFGSYFAVSRYSLWYNSERGLEGFLYTPVSPETVNRHHDSLGRLHCFLVYFYYPVWAFDYYILGGPYWSRWPEQENFLDWSGVHPEK